MSSVVVSTVVPELPGKTFYVQGLPTGDTPVQLTLDRTQAYRFQDVGDAATMAATLTAARIISEETGELLTPDSPTVVTPIRPNRRAPTLDVTALPVQADGRVFIPARQAFAPVPTEPEWHGQTGALLDPVKRVASAPLGQAVTETVRLTAQAVLALAVLFGRVVCIGVRAVWRTALSRLR